MLACFTWMPACSSPCVTVVLRLAAAHWQGSSRRSPCSVCGALCQSAAACGDWESGLPHLCGETSSTYTFLYENQWKEGIRDTSKSMSVRWHLLQLPFRRRPPYFFNWFLIVYQVNLFFLYYMLNDLNNKINHEIFTCISISQNSFFPLHFECEGRVGAFIWVLLFHCFTIHGISCRALIKTIAVVV